MTGVNHSIILRRSVLSIYSTDLSHCFTNAILNYGGAHDVTLLEAAHTYVVTTGDVNDASQQSKVRRSRTSSPGS